MNARFLEAADQVDRAACAIGSEAELSEVMKVLRYREEMQIALTNQALHSHSRDRINQKECLPLRDEGDDFGRVEARIPKKLFFGLLKQKNFGFDGFTSNEGMRDFAASFPQFMCKTVSGKTTVGYTRPQPKGVWFGRGTMTFAK